MSLFGNLTTEGHEETQDRIGGFSAYDSDAYTGKIKVAYVTVAKSGAQAVNVIVDLPGGEFRTTEYVTNKEGKNFYHPKKQDGTPILDKKQTLAGYTVINDLCFLTVEKELKDIQFEDKVVNIWDSEAKKEVPKSVPVAVELIGQEVTLGILKQIVDKQTQNAAGEYVNTGETREENVIDKVFNTATKLTFAEVREAIKNNTKPDAVFFPKWVEKNKGTVRDRSDKKAAANGGKSGKPGQPPQAGQNGGQARPSLFSK